MSAVMLLCAAASASPLIPSAANRGPAHAPGRIEASAPPEPNAFTLCALLLFSVPLAFLPK